MYNIISVCGSGVATSTLVAERLKVGLEEEGIEDVTITESTVMEIGGLIQNNPPDVLISTTSLESVDLAGIRHFDGLPILINMNTRHLYCEIADYLRQLPPR